ncbi:MAG: hypothetical protein HQ568_01810 [Calditrichaeota bacterium]|nr:hypothetical protein [Calditrichota bacterium]
MSIIRYPNLQNIHRSIFGLLAKKHDGKIDSSIERLRAQHEIQHNLLMVIRGKRRLSSESSTGE